MSSDKLPKDKQVKENSVASKKILKKDNSLITKPKNSRKLLVVVGLLFSLGILFVCIIVGVVLIVGGVDQEDKAYNAGNAIEELELYTKDTAIETIESLNMSKISDTVVDQESNQSILDHAQSNQKKLQKLKPTEIKQFAGKTFYFAYDMDYKADNRSENEDNITDADIKLNSDVYLTFSEDLDEESFKNLFDRNYIEDPLTVPELTEQQIKNMVPNIRVIGNVDIDYYEKSTYEYYSYYNRNPQTKERSMTTDLSGKFDIKFVDGVLYLKLTDVEVPDQLRDDPDVKKYILAEDKVIRINTKPEYERVIGEIARSLQTQSRSTSTDMSVSEQFDGIFANLDAGEREFLSEYGDEIEKVLISAFERVEIFNNYSQVDAIRSANEFVCSQADVNYMSIFDQSINVLGKIRQITMDYESKNSQNNYRSEGYSDTVRDLDELKKMHASGDLQTTLRSCNSQKNGQLQGFGLDLVVNRKEVGYKKYTTNDDISMDFLLVDSEYPEKVSAPEYDVDLTDEFML